jgi:hypothetical protein
MCMHLFETDAKQKQIQNMTIFQWLFTGYIQFAVIAVTLGIGYNISSLVHEQF